MSWRGVFASLSLSSGQGGCRQTSVYDELVSSLDIVATAAAAAGISLPMDRVYDGLNVVPYLAGEQVSPVRTLFWRWFGLGPDGPPFSQKYDLGYAPWAAQAGH